MRGGLAGKLLMLSGGLLAVLLLAGLPSLGQGVTDPSGELTDAECYGHHKTEGFRSMDLFPQGVTEVPKGQPFEFKLTIRNPWLHELRDLAAYVNISNAPGLSFPGEKPPVEQELTGAPEASPAQVRADERNTLQVDAQATEAVVRLMGAPGTAVPGPLGAALAPDYDLEVLSPDGAIVVQGLDPGSDLNTPASTYDEIRLNQTQLLDGGAGVWKVRVLYRGPEAGSYTLQSAVYYNLSKATQLHLEGPPALMPGESHVFTFTINAKDVESLQSLRFGGIGHAYNNHADANTEDDGVYDKWNTIQFNTGTELQISGAVVDSGGLDLLGPVFRRWAQVLGFAGTFLIIPSLVMGGTFGKGSVSLLNKAFGGPRTRVLFHNSMSFWLLGVSLLHMFLFLYESFWSWSHGLVWGGLSLACMIGLGVTGATQRSFVAKWGFNRWRFVHFAMGILVFVFVLVHIVADGTHLAPIRDLFGVVENR